MSLLSDLMGIFYSSTHAFTGDRSAIQEIAFLVEHGYLGFERMPIGTLEDYRSIRNNPKLIEDMLEAHGGSTAHIALKILAERYLRNDRGISGKFEHPFCGYFPDVISTNQKIIIECGQTGNPEKLYTYFLQGDVDELIQLPYPSEEDDVLFGYSFTEREHLKDFLRDLEKARRNEVKNLKNYLNRQDTSRLPDGI